MGCPWWERVGRETGKGVWGTRTQGPESFCFFSPIVEEFFKGLASCVLFVCWLVCLFVCLFLRLGTLLKAGLDGKPQGEAPNIGFSHMWTWSRRFQLLVFGKLYFADGSFYAFMWVCLF